jgi:hypothetical protein
MTRLIFPVLSKKCMAVRRGNIAKAEKAIHLSLFCYFIVKEPVCAKSAPICAKSTRFSLCLKLNFDPV